MLTPETQSIPGTARYSLGRNPSTNPSRQEGHQNPTKHQPPSLMTEEHQSLLQDAKQSSQPIGEQDVLLPGLLLPFTRVQWRMVLLSLILSAFLASLDSTIVAATVPSIVRDLSGGSLVSWIVSSYLISSTATVPVYGRLSDVLGRRVVFVAGQIIFVVGSVSCGLASNMIQLIVFRAIQGIGCGGLLSLVPIVLGDATSPRDRGRYAGLFGIVYAVACVAGPLVGGVCSDYASWRWSFFLSAPFGVAAAVLTTLFCNVPKMEGATAGRRRRIDVAGSLLISGFSVTLMLALTLAGSSYPWQSLLIILLLCSAAVSLCLFICNVLFFASSPIIAVHVFRSRTVSLSSLISCAVGAALFCGLTYLPLFFNSVQNDSATLSGAYLLPLLCSFVISSVVSGAIFTRTGKYVALPVSGMMCCTLGFFLLTRIRVDSAYYDVGAPAILVGIGVGASFQTLMVAVQNDVAAEDMASASALIAFFRSLSGAIGVAVFQAIVEHRLSSSGISDGLKAIDQLDSYSAVEAQRVRTAFALAIADGFYFLGSCSALALVSAVFMKNKQLRSTKASSSKIPSGGTLADETVNVFSIND